MCMFMCMCMCMYVCMYVCVYIYIYIYIYIYTHAEIMPRSCLEGAGRTGIPKAFQWLGGLLHEPPLYVAKNRHTRPSGIPYSMHDTS